MYKALFLDRDGVININHGYVYTKEDFDFLDGIFDLCRKAVLKGYKIFIVTNQSGIGRGYYSVEDFWALTSWMCDQFDSHGIKIDKVYFSPFHVDAVIPKFKGDHFSRKPNPGMILQAMEEFDLDLDSSIMVGDKASDIEAGIAAGVGLSIHLDIGFDAALTRTSAKNVKVNCLGEITKLL
jgi:D-glycero-D-manno-heptose 1,7-bisphosphate phosphatase